MDVVVSLFRTLVSTIGHVLPIALIVFGFQLFVLRRRIPNLRRVLVGFVYVLMGLAFFLEGLERALFPLGRMMAEQLTAAEFLAPALGESNTTVNWLDYYWVCGAYALRRPLALPWVLRWELSASSPARHYIILLLLGMCL
jgi:hypothetical protein